MTVSAVLNNRKSAASAQTRERVLRVIEEMNYHPSAVARGLARRHMNTIGVVMAYGQRTSLASDRYFGPVLDGVFEASKAYGQRTLIITEDTWEEAYEKLPTYFDGHCDGLLFILPTIPSEYMVQLNRRNIPFAIVGEAREEAALSVVDLDNVAAGFDATAYLISCGHRRIAYFGGDGVYQSSGQRGEGYRHALASKNIPVDDRYIVPGHYSEESGYQRTSQLLKSAASRRPTAIFCGDDWIALGALRAAVERGVRVPEELSLVGINNNPQAELSKPAITTIDNPLRAIGKSAVDIVFAQIHQGALPGSKRLIRGEMIVRESVADV